MPQQGPQPWPQISLSCLGRAGREQQELQMSEPCLSSQPATCTPCHQDTTDCKRVCLRSGKAHGYLGSMQVLVFQDKGNKFSLRRSTGTRMWQPGDTGGTHVPGSRKPAWGYPSARVSQVPLLTPGKCHSTSSNSQTQTLISPPSTTQLTQGANKDKESPRHLNQELSPGVQCPQKGSSSTAGVMFISSEGLVSHL